MAEAEVSSRSPRPSRSLDEGFDAWSASAAAVLAKSRRVDVDELPGTAESLLSTRTSDGLTIRPLYTRRDETDEPGLPGAFPFVRGADPARDVVMGWRVTERFGDEPSSSPAELNDVLLEALGNGASGLWLAIGDHLHADDLGAVLSGVLLDLIPITLDAGADGIPAARALIDLRTAAGTAPAAAPPQVATTTSLGFSPLTAAFSGRPTVDAAAAIALAADVCDGSGIRAFRVDGTDFATAGADDGLELALSVAAAVAHLRELTGVGLSPAAALGQISFAVSVDDDQFAGIAKLRALRRMWARVAQVVGAPEAGGAVTHAVTDLAMATQRDPWVNMLRTTIAAFGAGVGGADQVTVLGFDAALPTDHRTSSPSFSRRIARNTQLLLLEESNLGRVIDPGGGSWYVESLTDDLAANAWAVFTEIEAAGGYRPALDAGWITERVDASLQRRDVEVAHRRISVTGVNEFPNLAEKPLGADVSSATELATATPKLARIARHFEQLRDRSDEVLSTTGARPRIVLLPLGPVAEHNARTTFVANLLAAGGIDAVNPGPVTADTVGDTLAATPSPIAVLCGSKARYASDGPAVLAAARAAGIATVLLAGPEKEWPDPAVDEFPAEGSTTAEGSTAEGSTGRPDGSLRVGIDAVATLTDLLDRLDGFVTDSAGASK